MLQLSDIIGIEAAEEPFELPEAYRNMTTEMIMVDAEMAAMMLRRNVEPAIDQPGTNRRSQPHLIDRYRDIILNNEWAPGHQGIAFDVNGALIDGAHRLKAILRADAHRGGIAVAMNVTINVPPGAMQFVDMVRRRSLIDRLTMLGYANATILGAMARLLWLHDRALYPTAEVLADPNPFLGPNPLEKANPQYWSNMRPARVELEEFIAEHKESMTTSARLGTHSHLLTATAVAAGHWLCMRGRPGGDMATFLSQLADGAHIGPGDPVFALRRLAINGREGGSMPRTWEQIALFIKAYTAFCEGKRVQIAVFKPTGEPFPRP